MNRGATVLAFALAAVMAVGVAGCGGSSDSGSESTPANTDLSGTVTVWDYEYKSFPQYTEAIEQIDADFERLHPGVTIERVAQPFENYESLVRAAFAAREGPDVMQFLPGKLGVLQFSQGLEVLNDRVSPELQEDLIGWETSTEGFGVEGDHYGVPIGLSGEVFYYNKKLFAKAGLPTDFDPQTWGEVEAAAEKLKAAGIEPFAAGNKNGEENSTWFSAGWQTANTAEQAVEVAEGEIPLTDESVTKAFEPEFSLQEAGLFPADRFSASRFVEAPANFSEGKAAMIFGFWAVGVYWGEFDPALGEENVGVFFPPGSKYVGYETDHVLSIPSFAKNKDAAWALIEYEASPAGMKVLADIGGNIPNLKGVGLPASAPEQPKELLDTATKAIEEGLFHPYIHIMLPGTVALEAPAPLATDVNEALQGRMSLAEAQEAMQESFEKAAE